MLLLYLQQLRNKRQIPLLLNLTRAVLVHLVILVHLVHLVVLVLLKFPSALRAEQNRRFQQKSPRGQRSPRREIFRESQIQLRVRRFLRGCSEEKANRSGTT